MWYLISSGVILITYLYVNNENKNFKKQLKEKLDRENRTLFFSSNIQEIKNSCEELKHLLNLTNGLYFSRSQLMIWEKKYSQLINKNLNKINFQDLNLSNQ